MYLAKLQIQNFRGIKELAFPLGQHSILLGRNNSGKSTIIDAIGLLLGNETLVHNINDYDFYGGNPQPIDRIIIKGLICGFQSNDPQKHGDWFNDNNGGIPYFLDIETGELASEQNEEETLKLSAYIGFAARFEREELEFETKRYFVSGDIDPFEDESCNLVNKKISKQIGFFLLPSKRNWEKIISFGSEVFRKVVEFQNAIPSDSICKIRDELRNSPNGIEKEDLKVYFKIFVPNLHAYKCRY
jgi:putative ATP-dependent endonuclease of OLD family